MLPTLQVGPLAIQLPGLLILAGLWLGLSLAERHAWRFNVKPTDLFNLALIALLAGIIGARLAYVVRYPAAFALSPMSIFSLNPGLLDPLAGLATAVLSGLVYGQRKNLSFWSTLDALTPALAVLLVAQGLANLASGAAFGAPTSLPWAVELWGAARHPTQVYETLAAGIVLGLIWPGKGLFRSSAPGVYFLTFVALSSGSRLFLEAFRGDSQLLWAGLRSTQLAAWLALAASLLGITYKLQRKQT